MGRDGLAAVALAGLVLTASGTARAVEPTILPLDAHASEDARALAQEHAKDLRVLETELARCSPLVAIQRNGIAFRRPRGATGAPSLTLWVWLGPPDPPRGATVAGRATEAFGRYGHALFARLLGRSAVFADDRVAGYGLVLTWLGPTQRGGRLVGESLAVFADKLAVANYVHGTIDAVTFGSRAQLRAFDGETELPPVALPPDDGAAPAVLFC